MEHLFLYSLYNVYSLFSDYVNQQQDLRAIGAVAVSTSISWLPTALTGDPVSHLHSNPSLSAATNVTSKFL